MSNKKNIKILFGVAILFLSQLLTGCNPNNDSIKENSKESALEKMQYDLSDSEIKKVVISYEEEENILKNDQAEQFVEFLNVSEWKPEGNSKTTKGEETITCELYESINVTKERHVATLSFYDNNTVALKSGILQLLFTVSNDVINHVKQYVK